MKKIYLIMALCSAWVAGMACTNFVVGKDASVDGSTMVSYAADSYALYGYLHFAPAAKHAKGAVREVKRIILSRPAVEAGEKLGFLPGDMKEKIDPYLQPLYDALQDMIPGAKLNEYMERGVIQIAPLAFMRGRTLADAIVILDEAQNTTTAQLKMFLTRLGIHGKMIITGDLTQIDLPASQKSGLKDAIERLQDIRGIAIVEFNQKDIVRHHLVKHIVAAYNEKV